MLEQVAILMLDGKKTAAIELLYLHRQSETGEPVLHNHYKLHDLN